MTGCVALKAVGNNYCEMRRLHVRPQFLGQNFGRLLVAKLIDAAREVGYSTMRLDTTSSLVVDTSLYQEMGFVASESTYQQNEAGLTFMALGLVGGADKK